MAHRIRSYFRHHWRGIVNILTFVALGIFIYAIHGQIIDTFRNIKTVHYWFLLLMLPLQILNYDSYARMYRLFLRKLGARVKYSSMYRVALELNFVNHVFPSGGISGFSYFSLRLKDYDVRTSTATVVQLLRFFMGYLAFIIILGLGIISLAANGRANNLVVMLATFLASLIVFGTLIIGYIIGDNDRINGASSFLARLMNRLIAVFRPGKPDAISLSKLKSAMDEMHRSYVTIKDNLEIVKRGIWYGFLTNATEILTIYVVYLAFGEYVNIGAVILAYAVANFAGLVSVLPGGVGIYEALMTATLVAAGVPAALSLPVTVMYRVLSITFQIIPGWILYHAAVSDGGKEEHAA